jgi:predicted dinucleotide-binding enzyme
MNIAIIGSGKVGRALGKWAASRDQFVSFTSRHPESAEAGASAAGPNARATDLATAVVESDVVFLTLPFAEIITTLASVRCLLKGKTVVDVTNPITPDHRDLTVGHGDSGAEQIARALPEAHVVKAFNAVFAEVYAAETPRLGGQQVAIFYAGDDVDSKRRVSSLIELLGFEAIDAGPLRNARYLEPLSLLNIHLGRVLGNGTLIGFSLARAQPRAAGTR